jgi:hypothetical protein
VSSEYPPLTCKEVKQILKKLGFEHRPGKSGTAHENWVRDDNRGFKKVTVDCHLSPFSQILIKSMAFQAGISKKEFYKVLSGADNFEQKHRHCLCLYDIVMGEHDEADDKHYGTAKYRELRDPDIDGSPSDICDQDQRELIEIHIPKTEPGDAVGTRKYKGQLLKIISESLRGKPVWE